MKRIRKWLCLMLIAMAIGLSSCTGTVKMADGSHKELPNYGLFNPEAKSDKYDYKMDIGAVIVGVIFSETVIVPIIIVGWELFTPYQLASE